MAKNTPNYEFKKPEQNDFYDVDVQNRNWDKAETALTEFDDSGSVDEIKSFPDFLKKFVTGNKLAVTMRNLKAGMQFVLHAGQIVNNCVTDNAGLPLSAAQGKALMDKYTQLYSDLSKNIIAKTFNAQVSVKANEGYICDVPFTVPDGYELLDVVDVYILGTPVALCQQGIVEDKIRVYLQPFFDGSGNVYVKVLFKKKS